MAGITLKNLIDFHIIDRIIFAKLIVELVRDPTTSLLVIAFWHSLENLKFGKILDMPLVDLAAPILNELADEAVKCLSCLHTKILPDTPIDLPFTASKTGKCVSLKMIYSKKYSLISGIKASLTNVYGYVFADLLVKIFPVRDILNLLSFTIPGFPHPTFGPLTVIRRSLDYVIPSDDNWIWSLKIKAPLDDRTIFLTFSRGYPVTESEVIELFNAYYGDCVEGVFKEEPEVASTPSSSTNPRLFARLVVNDIETIDQILNRGPIAKFKINGKHVWARKFERREIQV